VGFCFCPRNWGKIEAAFQLFATGRMEVFGEAIRVKRYGDLLITNRWEVLDDQDQTEFLHQLRTCGCARRFHFYGTSSRSQTM
jgi:hypothetical protein